MTQCVMCEIQQYDIKIDHCYNGIEKCFEMIERIIQRLVAVEKNHSNNCEIEKTLIHLRKIVDDVNIRTSAFYATKEIMADHLAQHNKQIKELQEWVDLQKQHDKPIDKKPYKCPLCDTQGWLVNCLSGERSDCHACEAKGIVWG